MEPEGASANTLTSRRNDSWRKGKSRADLRPRLAIVIAWSQDDPRRIGEIAFLPQGEKDCILGRGGARAEDPAERLLFFTRLGLFGLSGHILASDQLAYR